MDSVKAHNQSQYDNNASDWQQQMDTNVGHRYLEKPAMQKELPEVLVGQDVLCVGIGTGHEINDIQRRGPNKLVGIDISKELLKIAEENYPTVEFKQLDMMCVADEFPRPVLMLFIQV